MLFYAVLYSILVITYLEVDSSSLPINLSKKRKDPLTNWLIAKTDERLVEFSNFICILLMTHKTSAHFVSRKTVLSFKCRYFFEYSFHFLCAFFAIVLLRLRFLLIENPRCQVNSQWLKLGQFFRGTFYLYGHALP